MKARLAAVALSLLAGWTSVRADTLQQSYLGIYLAINDANRHEAGQDYLGALVQYEAAKRVLARIQAKDPQWESTLVTRRLGDCELKVAELKPLAAFQLAKLNNEWSIDTAVIEGKDSWSALERAQAKVTYMEVLQINHPELAKAGMGEGVKEADKNVNELIDALLAKSVEKPPAGGVVQ
jgi:hypothetical protein